MVKVNCKFCKFEEESKCKKKGCSVKLNKRRSCEVYVEDEDKVLVYIQKKRFTSKPEVIEVDSRVFHDRNFRRRYNRMVEQEISQYETTANNGNRIVETPHTSATNLGSKHPMTGDLSRFISSAVEGGTK